MKIAFFGTPEFAWNILSWVLEYSEIDIKLIVSQPDRAAWRKKELFSTPVKQTALDNKIVLMQPEKILKNLEFHEALKNLDLDFIVVVAYGKIIPQAILDIPKYGCVNIHGSILPKYRWASPVQAAVKDGLKQTWLTTIYMSKGMDEWDMLKIGKVDIDNVDTSEDIFKKFVAIGPELLVQTLREIISWDLKAIPQDPKKASHCWKISREDGEVFFGKQSAQEIYNTFRAYTPWPGIYTWYDWKRLVLEEVILHIKPHLWISSPQGERIQEWGFEWKPWEFIKLSKNTYGIICSGNKILEIHRVKLEGKKSMDTMSFVNGNREILNYTFM
jgi:methionyl-tRNA formyltransferase